MTRQSFAPHSLRWHAAVAVVGVVLILLAGAIVASRLIERATEEGIDIRLRFGVQYARARLMQLRHEATDHARELAADADRLSQDAGTPTLLREDGARRLSDGSQVAVFLERPGQTPHWLMPMDANEARTARPDLAAPLEGHNLGLVEWGDHGLFVVVRVPLESSALGESIAVVVPIDSQLFADLERDLDLDLFVVGRQTWGVNGGSADSWSALVRDGTPRRLTVGNRFAMQRYAALSIPSSLGSSDLAVVTLQRRATGVTGPNAARVAFVLIAAATALFLLGFFVWSRRRVLGSVDALVNHIEAADPEEPAGVTLPPLAVQEIERLRVAFARFFDRFAAGKARQAEAEGTLGQVLRDAADAILVLDRERRVLQWNGGAEEIFGYTAREIVGRPYALLCAEGEEEPAFGAGTAVKDLRTRRRRKDGEIVDVSVARSRLSFSRDGDERFVEIVRDVSAKRRFEQELMQSEKLAAVGKISSKVVHEIRNPLAAINLNVELLAETVEEQAQLAAKHGIPFDPEAADILAILKRETRRLSQIAEEYLQFSRLPRAEFQEEPINEIVIELFEFLRPELDRRRILLTRELDQDEPRAVCDATLLRQALLNLVRNAVDAVSPGEGQVTLATRAGGIEDEAWVEFEVRDNGRGIEPGQRVRIFEPFFTTKKDGTGLGLALVQRAAEEHGGSVTCESVPGSGTWFRLRLPRNPVDLAPLT